MRPSGGRAGRQGLLSETAFNQSVAMANRGRKLYAANLNHASIRHQKLNLPLGAFSGEGGAAFWRTIAESMPIHDSCRLYAANLRVCAKPPFR